jgi:hypothetical protein
MVDLVITKGFRICEACFKAPAWSTAMDPFTLNPPKLCKSCFVHSHQYIIVWQMVPKLVRGWEPKFEVGKVSTEDFLKQTAWNEMHNFFLVYKKLKQVAWFLPQLVAEYSYFKHLFVPKLSEQCDDLSLDKCVIK